MFQNGRLLALSIVPDMLNDPESHPYRQMEAGVGICVGSSSQEKSSSLVGHVSEFRVWSTQRSTQQIQSLMNQYAETLPRSSHLACHQFKSQFHHVLFLG